MSIKQRIAVAGTAGNPLSLAHREFAEALTESKLFKKVLWFPSGLRSDKPQLIEPHHRVRMHELMFNDSWRAKQETEFVVDLRDVYRENTPTIHLLNEIAKEYPNDEIVFATGVDVLDTREHLGGTCEVETWDEGRQLMNEWTFAVVPRLGYTHPSDLMARGIIPPHFLTLEKPLSSISSTEIRERIKNGLPFGDLVSAEVEEYIIKQQLYKE